MLEFNAYNSIVRPILLWDNEITLSQSQMKSAPLNIEIAQVHQSYLDSGCEKFLRRDSAKII